MRSARQQRLPGGGDHCSVGFACDGVLVAEVEHGQRGVAGDKKRGADDKEDQRQAGPGAVRPAQGGVERPIDGNQADLRDQVEKIMVVEPEQPALVELPQPARRRRRDPGDVSAQQVAGDNIQD